MLKVNFFQILTEAHPASVAASEVSVATFNSELIVISLPKSAPGNSTMLLTLVCIEEIYQVHENRSAPLKINSSHCGLGSCTLQ